MVDGNKLRRHVNLYTVIYFLVLIAGIFKAITKYIHNKPEWSFWVKTTHNPMSVNAQYVGPYLPGIKGFLTIFTAYPPYGYILFLALNVLSCLGISYILLNYLEKPVDIKKVNWLCVCMYAPTYLCLQNNQLIILCVFSLLFALLLLKKHQTWTSGLVCALSIIFKSLVLPILVFTTLLQKWKFTILSVLLVIVISFTSLVICENFSSSVQAHLNWPAKVMDRNPENASPNWFDDNHSAYAESVRMANHWDLPFIVWLHKIFSVLAFGILVYYTHKNRNNPAVFWLLASLWMAWIAYVTPFGRYYYLILLVPAWYLIGIKKSIIHQGWKTAFWYLPLFMFIKKLDGMYVVVTLVTLIYGLYILISSIRNDSQDSNLPPETA